MNENDLSGMCPWCVVVLWAALRAYPYAYTALSEANASYGGASGRWSKGRASSSTKNMEEHYAKHAKDIGAKDLRSYNRSARNTINRNAEKHTYKNGRQAYRDKRGRITVTDSGGRLVTHFKPSSSDRYWILNIKRR